MTFLALAGDDSTLQALLTLVGKFDAYEETISKAMLDLGARVKGHAKGNLEGVEGGVEQGPSAYPQIPKLPQMM